MMKRYACIFLLFHFLFVNGDDTQTMRNLSKSLPPSSNGKSWNTSSKNPCLWAGVVCRPPVNNVTSLSLSGLGLTTSPANPSSALAFFKLVCALPSLESLDLSLNSFAFVPPSFFSNCRSLKSLNFSSNALNVSLVDFASLSNLEALDLSSNLLQGEVVTQLDGLRRLKILNLRNNTIRGNIPLLVGLEKLALSANRFDGKIPREISQLKNLTFLDLSMNMLSGSIPNEISQLKNLTFLDLSLNSLSGSIPDEIGMLSKLNKLVLSSNLLQGRIPSNLSSVPSLQWFAASQNNFTGPIPSGITSQWKNLTFLDLSMNSLSGSIPDEIGMLSKLKVLILSSNLLEGRIPSNLSYFPSLNWFAANQNNFSGPIPSGITRSLKFLDLSFNKLNGQIPPDLLSPATLEYVDLSSNMLQGPIPVNFSQRLVRLRLGGNNLTGMVPSSFQQSPNLTYLELNNNGLEGEIPWQLAMCRNLTLLNLASNRLNGTLPKGLGSLSKLVIMKLQENTLTGEIPNEFSNLTKLSSLNLSRNSFSGPIPSTITNLLSLQNLNLAANRLEGSIPSNIIMMNLIELQLGDNQLSGTIPRMPSSLNSALNLSNNHFSGSIPSFLGGLSLLEILDLSDNNFTGEVPLSLAQMPSLTLLGLSNNQLSGTLPSFPKHVTVLWTGNTGLVDPTSVPAASPERKHSRTWIIIVSLVGAIIGAVLASAIVYRVVSKRFPRVEVEGLQLEEGPQVINGCYITSDIIHRSNIDFTKAMEVVGNPSNIMFKTRFSTYYKAVMPSGSSYTVKKLNWDEKIFQTGSNERFGQQLQVLGRLSNSNIMVPLAYVLTRDTAYLFYDHVPKGTVYEFLHKNSENALDWQSRYSIALGVAQGLTFLHGCTQPVFLLDLSTKSIHLKSMKEPRIGDIELCKVMDPSKGTGSLSAVAGSVGYIPPEYAYTMRVTAAGNVYSFGVVLLELLTGKPPVSEGIELAKWALGFSSRIGQGEHILDSRVSNASPEALRQMLAVLKVALSCVSLSPGARPKMRNVLRSLFNAR